MLTGRRYRVIFYFAALVLCLSVCFAFAEEPASIDHYAASMHTASTAPASDANATSVHFLYYATPGRASFQSTLSGRLVVEPVAAPVQVASADAILQQLSLRNDRHHTRRLTIPSKHRLKLIKAYAPQPLPTLTDSALAANSSDSNE